MARVAGRGCVHAGPARARAGRRVALAVLAACVSTAALPAAALAKAAPKPPSSYLAGDRTLVNAYAAVEGARLGIVLPGGPEHFIEVKESSAKTLPTPDGPAVAETPCHDAKGEMIGPATGCLIEFATSAHTKGEQRENVAHEVFHVFQQVMAGTLANFYRPPYKSWLIEGSAAWVESDLFSHDRGAHEWWKRYLREPQFPLFKRTYTAIGFFGHMAQVGLDPWKRFKAMFTAESSTAAYAAAVGGDTGYFDSEASVFFRDAAFGTEWNATGPNVPSAHEVGFKPRQVTVSGGAAPHPIIVPATTDAPDELILSHLPKDEALVELRVEAGYARIRSTSGPGLNQIITGHVVLCGGSGKECECPTSPVRYSRFSRGDLAITGADTGAVVDVRRLKPCDVLLPLVSCNTLLPGFSTEVSEGLGHVVGVPSLSASAGKPGGSTASDCAFLEKGFVTVQGEFIGVIAPLVGVLRAETVAGAAFYYGIITKGVPPGYTVTHPPYGEESVLYTRGSGAEGDEFSSYAIIREHNVVADYALISTPGNEEADPKNSLALLKQVAGRL
jgi:hypothetical protein